MLNTQNQIIQRTYSDGRIRYIMHGYKDNEKKPIREVLKNKDIDPNTIKNMSVKCYKRLLKDNFRKLYAREYNENNCLFVTVTLKNKLDIKEVNEKFKQFIKKIVNHFGKVEYMRRLAVHKDNTRFHIHSVIEFETLPKYYKRKIKKLWNLGTCYIESVNKTEQGDIYNLFSYILRFEEEVVKQYYPNYTILPRKAKVVTISQHFGKISEYEDKPISFRKFEEKMKYYNGLKHYPDMIKPDIFIKIDKHYYYENPMNFNSSLQECLDNIFIVSKS